ncbi:MAG: radical SAM protein [Synergistaceae bacterium]|jgi:radical SAM superfamily enzyme with C-terminal helix-hairpin-helix motif|nr:radical SAM protein [Synergistaceae bacterium]
MKSLIIDGYVDEPACFGVPPYVSPYVRYCAGVLLSHGYELKYATCDTWRGMRGETAEAVASSDLTLVIMGLTVPGRYRGGSPLTKRELEEIAGLRRRGLLILGGPIRHGYAMRGGVSAKRIFPDGIDLLALGDPEASLDIFCKTGEWTDDALMPYDRLDEAAVAGAGVMRLHPSYPNVIAEMELSRGCDRQDSPGIKCSFCTEGRGGPYQERSRAGVAAEVASLYSEGVRAFRLGRCSNILAWGGERTPHGYRPNSSRVEELYRAIREAAPDPRMLHTDNCNPATVARFPDESASCVEAIAKFNTEGDGLSLGIECLDPAVREANGLKVSLDEAIAAVRLINEAGGARRTPRSMPSLLPGINFLSGLAGETKESFLWNRRFLEALLEKGLIVRRINIRRVMVFPGTELEGLLAANPPRAGERDYRRWKEWVRREVDPVMLERVAPLGTVTPGVILEERSGNVIFGRPLGSYPPLIGVASERHEPGERLDVMVTDWGSRSLTAVPWPLDINRCSRTELTALPGIGKARAENIASGRPYRSRDDIKRALEALDAPGLSEKLLPYFCPSEPESNIRKAPAVALALLDDIKGGVGL